MDKVVLTFALGDEAPCLPGVDRDPAIIVQMAGEIGVGLIDQLGHLRVEFHGIDLGCAVVQRQQYIGAAAGAKDQHVWIGEQLVWQRGSDIFEVTELAEVAVEAGDRTGIRQPERGRSGRLYTFPV